MIDFYGKGSPPGFTGKLIALHETHQGKFILIKETYEERIFIYDNTPKLKSADIGKTYYITTGNSKKWDEILTLVEAEKHADKNYGDECYTTEQIAEIDKWIARKKDIELGVHIEEDISDMNFEDEL